MKYFVAILCFILLESESDAQTRLTITYEHTTNSKRFVKKLLLVVNDSVSYSYPLRKEERYLPAIPLGSRYQEYSHYVDHSKRIHFFQLQPHSSPKYLIEDTLKTIQWELGDIEKIILGYTCKKAITTIGKKEITVFYCPELASPAGPFTFGGLPGTILQCLYKGSPEVTTAIEILKTAEEIVEPTDGKKITRKEFDKIVKQSM